MCLVRSRVSLWRTAPLRWAALGRTHIAATSPSSLIHHHHHHLQPADNTRYSTVPHPAVLELSDTFTFHSSNTLCCYRNNRSPPPSGSHRCQRGRPCAPSARKPSARHLSRVHRQLERAQLPSLPHPETLKTLRCPGRSSLVGPRPRVLLAPFMKSPTSRETTTATTTTAASLCLCSDPDRRRASCLL